MYISSHLVLAKLKKTLQHTNYLVQNKELLLWANYQSHVSVNKGEKSQIISVKLIFCSFLCNKKTNLEACIAHQAH